MLEVEMRNNGKDFGIITVPTTDGVAVGIVFTDGYDIAGMQPVKVVFDDGVIADVQTEYPEEEDYIEYFGNAMLLKQGYFNTRIGQYQFTWGQGEQYASLMLGILLN